jgi:hypothetical protein
MAAHQHRTENDERIIVAGGTWIRGNKQQLPQAYPCLVVWDETESLICDNEGPRALIRGPKIWMAIPPVEILPTSELMADTMFR